MAAGTQAGVTRTGRLAGMPGSFMRTAAVLGMAAILLPAGRLDAATPGPIAPAPIPAAPIIAAPIVPGSRGATLAGDPLAPLLKATLDAARAGTGDRTLLELLPFYEGRGFAPAFTGDPQRLERAQRLLLALLRADQEGLEPQIYEVDRLSALFTTATPAGTIPGATEQAEFELRLARALVRYARDVSTGRAGPEHEQDGGVRPADPDPPTPLLVLAATSADLPGWLQKLPPHTPQYVRLRKALAEWRAKLGRVSWTPVPAGRKLEPGMAGPEILALRRRLVEEGVLAAPLHPGQVSALYDQDLALAVKAFQARYGLSPDGVVGKRTFKALNATVAQRIDQIRANMERRRWMPRDLGERYIFVNLADFTLKMVDRGKTIHTSRVVVGAPYTSTPMMSHQISHVVLNPYWNVPRSIMIREMLPQLRQDPSWLFKGKMRLFSGWDADAAEVNPYTVDWSQVTAGNWRYRIRQDAGPQNALGVIKFMFPNADDIYLHDTPTKHLFKRSVRAFSHGCIRVEDPLALADLLLAEQGWPRQRMEQVVADGEPNRIVSLQRRVPIHLAYITAWVDRDGGLQLLDDVYGRDAMLMQALRVKNS